MRVTAPSGPAQPARLQHHAAFHRSRPELVGLLTTLARPALEAGRPVALALAPATEEALRAGLGRPDGLVALLPPRPVEAGSGQTLALRRARELRELTAVAGPVTVLAEHLPELDGPDGSFWTELEAASDVALADLPVQLTCCYPEMPLHLAVLDGARRTHPHLLVDGELRRNPAHHAPREVLGAHPAAAPVLLGVPDRRLAFRSWQLRDVRRTVREVLAGTGVDADRAEDVVLAVNEVATNAVEHGGAGAELHVWSNGRGIVCEVHDGGPLHDPLPGLVAPPTGDPRGRGLWIARQLCDLLHVWADAEGTHVRLSVVP